MSPPTRRATPSTEATARDGIASDRRDLHANELETNVAGDERSSAPRWTSAGTGPSSAGKRLRSALTSAARASLRRFGIDSYHVPTRAGPVHVFDVEGQGPLPDLVLIHGFSAESVHFANLIRKLRPHVRRIVAPDLPLHGLSTRRVDPLTADTVTAGLFEALTKTLKGPAWVFGNSLGGLAALRFAGEHPELARGLLLCSPAGANQDENDIETIRGLFNVSSHAEAVEFIDRLFARRTPFRHLLAVSVRRRLARPELRDLLALMSLEDALRPTELARLTMPVLLMWGCGEAILPREHFHFFRCNLPDVRVVECEGHGHSPYLDRADDVAAHLLAFMREHEHREPAGG